MLVRLFRSVALLAGDRLPAVTEPAGTPARPIVCAHRGASLQLPDNSIDAFEAAIASGCEMIETDVRADRQGRPMLSHDRLRPISPGSGHGRPRSRRSSGRPRPRPRRSRPAATVPVALESLLELSAGRIGLDLDIKEARVVPAVLDAIAGWNGVLLLTSFDPARDPRRSRARPLPRHRADRGTDAHRRPAQRRAGVRRPGAGAGRATRRPRSCWRCRRCRSGCGPSTSPHG